MFLLSLLFLPSFVVHFLSLLTIRIHSLTFMKETDTGIWYFAMRVIGIS